jgi:hypothetical protein
MTHRLQKKNKEISCFEVLNVRAEGCSCSLHVLYGGLGTLLGIHKLQLLIKKVPVSNYFLSCNFLVIKILDPDWIRIQIGIQSKMLDLDPESMDPDTNTANEGVTYIILSLFRRRMNKQGMRSPSLPTYRTHQRLILKVHY